VIYIHVYRGYTYIYMHICKGVVTYIHLCRVCGSICWGRVLKQWRWRYKRKRSGFVRRALRYRSTRCCCGC
jgi:hypothetical protein